MFIDYETISKVLAAYPIIRDIIKIINRGGGNSIAIKHLVISEDKLIKYILDGQFQDYFRRNFGKQVIFHHNLLTSA